MDFGTATTKEEELSNSRQVSNNIPGVASPVEVYNKQTAPDPVVPESEARVVPHAYSNIPGVSTQPSWTLEEQGKTEAATKAFKNMLIGSGNPELEEKKLQTTKIFSELTGKDFGFVYNHLDQFAQEAMGQPEYTPFVTAVTDGFERAKFNQELSDIGNSLYFAIQQEDEQLINTLTKRMGEINSQMPPEAMLDGNWFTRFFKKGVVGTVEQIPLWTRAFVEGSEMGLATGTAAVAGALIFGQAGPQAALGEEVLTVPASAIVGYTVGQATGSAQSIRNQTRGLQYLNFKEYGLNDDLAWVMADVIGAGEAFWEISQGGAIATNVFKGMGKDLGISLWNKGIEKGLKDNGYNAVIRRMASYAEDVAEQVIEEDIQEVSTILGEHVAFAIHNYKVSTGEYGALVDQATLTEDLERIGDTTVNSLSMMMVTVGAGRVLGGGLSTIKSGFEGVATETEARIRREEAEITQTGFEKSDEVFVRTETSQTIPIENIEAREDLTPERAAAGQEVFEAAQAGQKMQPIKVVETTPGNYRVASGNAAFVSALQGGLSAVEVEVVKSRAQAETVEQSREQAEQARPQYENIVNTIAQETEGSIQIARGDQLTGIKVDPGTATNLSSQMIFKTQDQADIAINRIREETTSFEVARTETGTNIRFALDNGYIAEVNVVTQDQFTADVKINPLANKLVTAARSADIKPSSAIISQLEQAIESADLAALQLYSAVLRTDQNVSAEVRDAAQAVYEEARKSQQKVFDSLQPRVEERVAPAPAPVKQDYELTPEEFAEKIQEPVREVRETQRKELDEKVLRELFRQEFPEWVADEQDAAVAVAEKIAKYKGQDVDQWLRENLTAEVFTRTSNTAKDLKQPRRKAAVTFAEDARALIHLSDNSDFSSWVHEIGHVLRRNLNEVDKALVEKEIGIEDGNWTVEHEEKFVRMLEDHLKNNTQQGTIFDKIADWFKEIYFALRDNIVVPENVAKLFDEIFGERVAEEALFQPAPPLESEAFKNWFKDSKVVNEDGSPKVVYHGTDRQFDAFVTGDALGWGRGVYFTDNKTTAEEFGGNIIEAYLSIQNPYIDNQTILDDNAVVNTEAFKIKNEEFLSDIEEVDREGRELTGADIPDMISEDGSFLNDVLRELGYDGVIAEGSNNIEGFEIVAFEPTQIKSTENIGTFNPADLRILFQEDKFKNMPEAVQNEAIETFGITFALDEAGYVLPDGRMLDFSGKHLSDNYRREGDRFVAIGEDNLEGTRTIEHDQIGPGIEDFLDMGGIRISARDRFADIGTRPTSFQYDKIRKISERGEILIELTDGTRRDHIISSAGFPKIKGQIERFYRGADVNRQALFQDEGEISEHEEIVRDAVAKGLPVPDDILAIYADRDWAEAEIQSRDLQSSFENLLEDARDTDSPEELRAQVEAFGEVPETMTEQELDVFYRKVWNRANLLNPEEAQKRWEETIKSDEAVQSILTTFADQRDELVGAGISSVKIWAAINQLSAGIKQTPKQLAVIRNTLKNAGQKHREILARIENDQEALQQIEHEKTLAALRPEDADEDLSKMTVHSRIKLARTTDDVDLRNKILKGNVSSKGLFALDKQYRQEIQALETKVDALNEDIDLRVKAGVRKTEKNIALEKKVSSLEKEVTKLDKEIETVKESKKARLTKLRTEKNQKITDLKAEMSDIVKSARAEAREGVKVAQAELKEAYKKKDALRKVRAYKQQLAKRILKEPSKNTAFEYKQQIRELQEALDGAFRRLDSDLATKTAKEIKEIDLAFFKDMAVVPNLPDEARAVIDEILGKLQKKPLNLWTLAELEKLDTQVRELRQRGRDLYRFREERRKGVLNARSVDMNAEVLEGDTVPEYSDLTSKETRKLTNSNRWWKIASYTFVPNVYVRNTAGLQEGEFYKFWVDDVNKAQDNESREVNRRRKSFGAMLKGIDYKQADLGKRTSLDGVKDTHAVSEIIGMYAASQNIQSHAAVYHGNKIQQMDRWIATLSEDEKAIGDWILDDFSGDNYNRLRDAHIRNTNDDLGKVDRYFPMLREGDLHNSTKEELAEQLLSRANAKKVFPDRKFTKERVENIPPEFQEPIRLDIVSLWNEQIQKQEHYISHYQWTKDANYMMGQTGMRASITAKHGRQVAEWYKNHINVIANPNIYKAYGMADKIVKQLRTNLAIAALGFNMSTVLKQAPSMMLYMSRAGGFTTGNLNLMKSSFQFTAGNTAKMYDTIRQKDPQWDDRVMSRYMEDLKSINATNIFTKAQKKLATASMFLIAEVDKAVTAIGWNAVYNHNLQFGEAEAVRMAQQATLETQPSGRAKDIPVMLQDGGALSLFTLFSNQTNKIYNMIVGDILPSVGRIASRKTPNAIKKQLITRTIANLVATSMSGVAMMVISGWVAPDDDDEFLKEAFFGFLKQQSGLLPIVGGGLQSGLSGYESGVDPFPVVNDMAKILKRMSEGKELSQKQVERTLISAGTVLGVPGTIEANRVKNVVEVTLDEGFAEGILEIFGPAFREGSIARELPGIIEEKIEEGL